MIRDERGSSSIALSIYLLAFMAVFALVSDVARVYAVKIYARHALNIALRAAASQLDLNQLADPQAPRIYIIPQQARQEFDAVLQENLKIDRWGNPLRGSIADGPVEVAYFQAVNSVPFTYTYGAYAETVAKPSVVGIIRVPVKLGIFAKAAASVPDEIVLNVHSTVGPEVVNN